MAANGVHTNDWRWKVCAESSVRETVHWSPDLPQEGSGMNGHSTNGHNNGQSNGHSKTDNFLQRVFELIQEEAINKPLNAECKVVEFKQPKELASCLDLEIGENGVSDDELMVSCQDTIKYSVKTNHPHFFNQLFAGLNEYGLAGAWITEALNGSQYTYEVAPVFTLMEQVVLKKMRDYIGYKAGDGIFCPGGSISNLYGVNLARYHKFPQVKSEGMGGLRLCAFASSQSHYSLKKAVGVLGIGVNNLLSVPCDQQGRMDPAQLEAMVIKSKADGYEPFFVDATSGTTVIGAYDPLNAIADVCERHGLWMHVDSCWGGGALLSKKHCHKMAGIDRADSVAWNAHKMMGAPLQCCAFLTKHSTLLKEAHCANATYLFQQDKCYDVSYDTGDKSVQCGRKVDVFKLWLMWKAKGDVGFEKSIDNVFAQAEYLANKVKETEGFELITEPECTNVCFWYFPPSLRGQERTEEWWQKVATVGPKIKERMMREGTMLVGYQPQGDKVNFFRMVIPNLETTNADMDFAINEIERLASDI